MGSGLIFASALLVALVLSACGPPPARDDGAPPCERGCLEDLVNAYLRALVARNPSGIPLANGATFVEDMQPVAIGAGTWTSITGVGGYRHIVADPSAGRVAAIVVVEEGGAKVLLNLTLHVANRAITHAESMMVRDMAGASRYEELAVPPSQFLATVASPARASRQALLAAVDAYYSRMERHDAAGGYDFLAGDCERIEHANSAGLGCRTQFDAGLVPFVTRVRDRRYVVVDEELQTVFAFALLDHDGIARAATPDGTTPQVPPYFSVPRTLQAAEMFRFERGKIRFIEMLLAEYPYGTRPASVTPAAATASADGSTAAEPGCDRECLKSVVARWLDALTTKRRDAMSETPGLRYTENGQVLQVGKGLWTTVTTVSPGRRVVVDPGSGSAGVLVGIIERDVPGALAARLKVEGGRLAEVEAVVARQELSPPDGDTATLFAPRLLDAFDAARFARDWAAFDRAGRDSLALSTPGSGLAEPFETPRERRQLVRDTVQGLTLELTLTDVTGAKRGEASTTGPFTVLAVSLTQEREGQAVAASKDRTPVAVRVAVWVGKMTPVPISVL